MGELRLEEAVGRDSQEGGWETTRCCRELGKRRPLPQRDSAGLWEVCTGVRRARKSSLAEVSESHGWLGEGASDPASRCGLLALSLL